jgi:hypothetical protein
VEGKKKRETKRNMKERKKENREGVRTNLSSAVAFAQDLFGSFGDFDVESLKQIFE